MDISPLFIVVFVAASIGGTALMLLAVRAGARSQEKYRALAQDRGWRYDHAPSTGGGASITTFSDPGGSWLLELYSHSSSTSGGSGSTRHYTEYRDSAPSIPRGMAVLGPEIPEKTKAMADKMMGMMGGDIGTFFLNKITGGLGEEAAGLRSAEAPGPGHLMASAGAEDALQDIRFAPELANARAGRNQAQQPIVMRGPFGLRVRIGHRLRKPEDIDAFVALGRALSDNLAKG